jgi:hypothetical protein
VIGSTVPVNGGGPVTSLGAVVLGAVVLGAEVVVVDVARAIVVVTATVDVALVAVVVDVDRRPTAFSVVDDPHAPAVSSVMAANAHARR